MERKPFDSMSVEELWQLHTVVNHILSERLVAKKDELERRLGLLKREDKPPVARVGDSSISPLMAQADTQHESFLA
jgi:hypothetical protein